jgi:hypothetical protein
MVKESLRPCEFGGHPGGSAGLDRFPGLAGAFGTKTERGRSKQSKSPRLTARGSAQIDADRSLKVPGVLDRLSLPYTTLHLS